MEVGNNEKIESTVGFFNVAVTPLKAVTFPFHTPYKLKFIISSTLFLVFRRVIKWNRYFFSLSIVSFLPIHLPPIDVLLSDISMQKLLRCEKLA